MEYMITLKGDNPKELATIFKLLEAGNIEAASTFEQPTAAQKAEVITKAVAQAEQKDAKQAPKGKAIKPPTPEQNAPQELENEAPSAEETTPEETVTVADLQAVARPLAASGKGPEVQRILKEHHAALLSKVAPEERAAVLAELKAAAEGKA